MDARTIGLALSGASPAIRPGACIGQMVYRKSDTVDDRHMPPVISTSCCSTSCRRGSGVLRLPVVRGAQSHDRRKTMH